MYEYRDSYDKQIFLKDEDVEKAPKFLLIRSRGEKSGSEVIHCFLCDGSLWRFGAKYDGVEHKHYYDCVDVSGATCLTQIQDEKSMLEKNRNLITAEVTQNITEMFTGLLKDQEGKR